MRTVSYTHLALNTVRFARGISYSDEIITTGYDDLDTTSQEDKNQTKRINEIMKEYRKESVSYTHLDVYKRQLLKCFKPIILPRKSLYK